MTQHPQGYVGIYDADGGIRGEAAYVVGHLLGRRECALCDITHSPVRRKPAWDRMVEDLGVPFTLLHRNELNADLVRAIVGVRLPVVLAKRESRWSVALDADALGTCAGDIDAFRDALIATEEAATQPAEETHPRTDQAGTRLRRNLPG